MAQMIRRAVEEAYSSKAWKDKVKKMTDTQVFAIYKRLQTQKKV